VAADLLEAVFAGEAEERLDVDWEDLGPPSVVTDVHVPAAAADDLAPAADTQGIF